MILLTGFEPFGGLSRNPTGDLARDLDGPGVRGEVLPVDHTRIGPVLADLLAAEWDAVVLTGVAIGRARVSLERVAINFRDRKRADNTGAAPDAEALVLDGPDAYFSTLPIDDLHDDLVSAGLPVEISLTAGAYLCNASFYWARHLTRGRGTPCGFVHLPPTPDLACAAEPLDYDRQMVAIVRILDLLGQSDPLASGRAR